MMLVKIKMPKERGGVVVSKPEEDHKKSSCKRVCEICQKEFSSGKALGGHMSSHVQLARDKKSMKQEKSSADSDSAVENSCAVCGRRFPSMKALSGHMRCHPERSWKGINPPPPDATCTTTDKEEKDRVVDLTESLTGWSATAKRGRKAIRPEDDPTYDAAVRFLMILARGEGGGGVGRREKDFDEGEAVEVGEIKPEGESEDDESSSNNSNKKRRKFGDIDDESMPTDHDNEGATFHTPLTETVQEKIGFDLNQLPCW